MPVPLMNGVCKTVGCRNHDERKSTRIHGSGPSNGVCLTCVSRAQRLKVSSRRGIKKTRRVQGPSRGASRPVSNEAWYGTARGTLRGPLGRFDLCPNIKKCNDLLKVEHYASGFGKFVVARETIPAHTVFRTTACSVKEGPQTPNEWAICVPNQAQWRAKFLPNAPLSSVITKIYLCPAVTPPNENNTDVLFIIDGKKKNCDFKVSIVSGMPCLTVTTNKIIEKGTELRLKYNPGGGLGDVLGETGNRTGAHGAGKKVILI